MTALVVVVAVATVRTALARCIRAGSKPLASGALGFHILDTMMAIEEAVTTGHTVDIHSTVDPVPLVADDWDPYATTL